MIEKMSSKERLLAAMNHQETDHVPLFSLWWPDNRLFEFSSTFERVEKVTRAGLDDTIRLEVPHRITSTVRHDLLSELLPDQSGLGLNCLDDVSMELERVPASGTGYPVLTKRYDTPSGTLIQSVRETDHWEAGEDIPLLGGFADMNVSNSVEFPVKEEADIECLEFLLQMPTKEQIKDFREYSAEVMRFAENQGVLVEGGWVEWVDAVLWLVGIDKLIFSQVDNPAFLEQLLEVLWQYEQKRLAILLEEKVDTIIHRGWYHGTEFWMPYFYREHIKPLLKKEIDLVHEAGKKYTLICTKDYSVYYDDFTELGIDNLWGVDPLDDCVDPSEIKVKLGGTVCLWGGVNAHVTLGMGEEEQIRNETGRAVEILGQGGGFILCPIDQISNEIPQENIEIFIDEWLKVRDRV
jgi:hypothetical protein